MRVRSDRPIPRGAAALCLVALATGAAPALADTALERLPGYVDGTPFVELAGEEGLSVEVNLHGPLLRAITRVDADLARLVGGLESIHAVVVDLHAADDGAGAREALAALERRLRGRGWERLAAVREGGDRVHVLVLSEGERIRGLTVLAIDGSEMVFANLAGDLDLAAIAELGEEMDLPGLDALGDVGR